MKLTHKQKLRIARRLMTKHERKTGSGAFSSFAWFNRSNDKLEKQRRQRERAEERKHAKERKVEAFFGK